MQGFKARLEKRPGLFAARQVTLPDGISLVPRKWSASDIGGAKAATIDAVGSPENLAYLLTWLGDRAFIHNEMSTIVWEGVVYEIEANLGGTTVSLSLETVYNRVAVIYSATLTDGSTESRQTDWAEDADSIARYGRREWLYSLPNGVDDTMAEVVRDRLLAQHADPAAVITTRGDNKFSTTLHCKGHWALLDFVYWTNDKGLASYEEFGGGTQYIGASLTDTTISFGASAAPPGDGGTDYVQDRKYTITTTASAGVGATTIAVSALSLALPAGTSLNFEGTEAILSALAALGATSMAVVALGTAIPSGRVAYYGRFAPLVEGTVVRISGAVNAANNAVTTVQHQHRTDIIETVENTQVNEAAGATVTVAIGAFGMVGYISQSFKIPSTAGWSATKVSVRVQRIGNPTDDLKISINSDSSGSPGSSLAVATIAGASVPTVLNWVEADLPSAVALSPGVTYWITVGRSGATSLSDYFILALDEDLGYTDGVMKVYNGSNSISGSWVTRVDSANGIKDADMPFRVLAEVDTVMQITDALAVSPEFQSVLPSPPTSGATTPQYRSDEVNILDEVTNLLDMGTSDGKRLIAHVDNDRNIIIQPVPDSIDANPMLGTDGRMRHASGALWEPGVLVYGRWIDIEAMPVLDGLTRTKGQRAVYIQECEYDPQTDRLMVQSEGALDPWQAIHFVKR